VTRRPRLPASARTALTFAIVGFVFALPLRELFRHQGPPMEEGFMLAFPDQVLDGQLPNRDFLHLYGPGSLWVLAGAFRAFGASLATERVVGLIQLLGIVATVTTLALAWGRRVALTAGLLCAIVVIPPVGLAALAWNGGIALTLGGVAVGLGARRRGDHAGRLLVGGALAGLGLLFRPDLALAVALGFGGLALGLGRRGKVRLLTGTAIGAAPILVHVALVGPATAIQGMVIDPVFKLRGGRSLPLPPSWDTLDGALQKGGRFLHPGWSLPAPAEPNQIFIWFFLLLGSVLTVAAVGVWGYRRDAVVFRHRVLLVVGLFGLGMLPQALQRPDSTHLAWVSCVPLAFLPVALRELHLLRRSPREHTSTARPSREVALRPGGDRLGRAGAFLPGAAVLLLVVLSVPYFTARPWLDYTRQSVLGRGVARWSVDNDGRNFWLSVKSVQEEVQRMLDDVGRMARPGDRVIVGPTDLRKTPYSDAYLYFLLPDLVPGTRYIEMDPGVANADDSGLDAEVAATDWLIQSNVWNPWSEPNQSRRFGSAEPNRVVRDRFCVVRDYGRWYRLLRQCR